MVGVHIGDLPPAYQAQALQKWREHQNAIANAIRRSPACPDMEEPGKKYHNRPTERVTASRAVLRFDSQKETRRYDELAALERAGQIRDLRMQVDFTLQEAYTDGGGRRVRAIRYRADFTYQRPARHEWESVCWADDAGVPWTLVVEDVKSRATRTKEYIMKRKLMKERFNIDIQEV